VADAWNGVARGWRVRRVAIVPMAFNALLPSVISRAMATGCWRRVAIFGMMKHVVDGVGKIVV
jgi:hypothetical protein